MRAASPRVEHRVAGDVGGHQVGRELDARVAQRQRLAPARAPAASCPGPGTPSISTWPPATSATSVCSTTSRWPTTALPISSRRTPSSLGGAAHVGLLEGRHASFSFGLGSIGMRARARAQAAARRSPAAPAWPASARGVRSRGRPHRFGQRGRHRRRRPGDRVGALAGRPAAWHSRARAARASLERAARGACRRRAVAAGEESGRAGDLLDHRAARRRRAARPPGRSARRRATAQPRAPRRRGPRTAPCCQSQASSGGARFVGDEPDRARRAQLQHARRAPARCRAPSVVVVQQAAERRHGDAAAPDGGAQHPVPRGP